MILLALLTALQSAAPVPGDTVTTLSIVVNLPAFRLDLLDSGRVVARFPVAIGMPEYPTPTGSYLVGQVELNPSWIPPASRWATGRRPMPPGPANPMGRAKLLFLPQYYIHGTPDTASLGSAASHGCVRLRNDDVLEIARRIIAAGPPALADSAVTLTGDPVTRRRVVLARAVPVEVRYDLIELLDGEWVAYPDVYGVRGALALPDDQPNP